MSIDCGICILREWRASDRESIVSNANNPKVSRNLTHRFPNPYTQADAEEWLRLATQELPAQTQWAIEVDGVAVGGIGIELGEGVYQKTAQFGYWLGEPYWGRGIVSAAAAKLAPHVMDVHDLVRLEAPVYEWNPASMRVLEKAGFARESVMRRSVYKEGQIIDAVMYALVR